MATTTKGFRYPVSTDTPNVPRDIGYLASDVDSWITNNPITINGTAVGLGGTITVATGFTNPMTTVGDIIIGGTSGAATRLAAGTNGYILTMSSGSPVWAVAPSGYSAPTIGSTSIASGATVTTIAGLTLTSPIINPTSASAIGLVVKGVSSQTANLQEWQDSAGTIFSSISSTGVLVINNTVPINTGYGISIYNKTIGTQFSANTATYTSNISFFRGNTVGNGMKIGSYGDAANGVASIVFADTNNASIAAFGQTGTTTLTSLAATSQALIVKGAASQTANLQEWQNSSGTVLASITSSGVFNSPLVTNAQSASYTAVLADAGKLVEISNASANNFTVPLDSSVPYAIGTQINILQTGAGQTTVVATSGVTINATPGLKLRAQWSSATLIKRATDTWVLVGDLSA